MTDQHAYKLSGLDDWQLEDSDDDLRGKTLMTDNGQKVGEIDDMLADTDQQRVVALRLTDGRVVNIDAVDLRDGQPVLLGDAAAMPPAPKADRRELTSDHIPIVEESLNVGKREVELGKVRINTRVVSETVGEDVSLREEHVSVDRRQMNERISASDADALLKEGTVEVAEHGERAVVSKEARVTGEVVIDKDVDTRTERVEGTVRHTEVDIDRDRDDDRRDRPAKR